MRYRFSGVTFSDMNNLVVMPGNTYSKKNSKQIIVNKATGKRQVISSKGYREWEEGVMWQLKTHPLIGRQWQYPLKVSFKFFRKTRRKFDYNNLSQGPLDILQKLGIIEDDDMNHVIPDFSQGWELDKTNPRVEITLEEL